MRQCSCRYAFHAGRNLPDKELRYLRTVIVTAAVYRGFGRQLSPSSLTYRHRAGVRPYTSSCELAESCVFDKQSQEPIFCGLQQREPPEAPLIPKLRGHFAEFLKQHSPERLRLLAPPTCVSFSTVAYCGAISWLSFIWLRHLRTRPCSTGTFSTPTIIHTTSLPRGAGILTCFPSSTPFGLN